MSDLDIELCKLLALIAADLSFKRRDAESLAGIARLRSLGWLRRAPSSSPDLWTITDRGREALAANTGPQIAQTDADNSESADSAQGTG